jgi:histone-lysine N-methyltransferase SETMAR
MEKISKSIKQEETQMEEALFESANFILPYLNPIELSSISSTCKTLNQISKSITVVRSSDASRTIESRPIPFVNAVDSHSYAFFIYTPTQTLISSLQRQSWGSIGRLGFVPPPVDLTVDDAWGCDCEQCGINEDCPCLGLRAELDELTRECGPSCGCGLECGNRVSQRGILVKLKIVRSEGKGWGLFADQFICNGDFVCEYAGEMLTTIEARIRQKSYDELSSSGRFTSALLVVKEHLPSGNACMRINIDATKVGNVGRFINHSCDGGNLSSVVVRSSGNILPRLCYFASRDIKQDEELSFSYGEIRVKSNGLKCFCGSSCCLGYLPCENT